MLGAEVVEGTGGDDDSVLAGGLDEDHPDHRRGALDGDDGGGVDALFRPEPACPVAHRVRADGCEEGDVGSEPGRAHSLRWSPCLRGPRRTRRPATVSPPTGTRGRRIVRPTP